MVPNSTKVLVIGGGPAGSYAATVLAREGFEVTLIERETFPRYHIGESMLPSCRQFLRFVGVEERVKQHGFTYKPGAAVKLNQYKREGYTDFIALNPENGAWNTIRSEFDEILLRHAQECGVHVFEGTQVNALGFKDGDSDTPVSADWEAKDGSRGTISFEWLVDASGRQGIVSTKYLKSRRFNSALRNIAFWGYWKDAGRYSPGTSRENAPWFEALTDESGWAWFIPLHNGTVSVGIVISEESNRRKKLERQDESGAWPLDHYLDQLKLAPGLMALLGDGRLVTDIKSAGDYSYASTSYAGPNYRIVGDAGAFIDPFFSSGVHLAFTGALSAASSIAASIRGHCTEAESIAFHNAKVGTSYTRFLVVVLGVYKQIRAQDASVLSDIDEDNFDRAFHFLRPVIQGAADIDPRLTEKEIQDTMDFCKNVFAPTNPKMHEDVAQRLAPSLTSPDGPVMDVQTVINTAGSDEEAKFVLWEVNARKPIHAMYDTRQNFTTEVLEGFYVRWERGSLGLVRA